MAALFDDICLVYALIGMYAGDNLGVGKEARNSRQSKKCRHHPGAAVFGRLIPQVSRVFTFYPMRGHRNDQSQTNVKPNLAPPNRFDNIRCM